MNNFSPDDFEEILDHIKHNINDFVDCNDIRSIESNFNTKAMVFNGKENRDGTVIVGEDNGVIAVDISVTDNAVRSFILKDKSDTGGIENIIGWFKENYKLEESLR
ncbi:hypothetical protein N4T77_11025 [Clostridium sp. CX1]|uniref:hypothetical protein n=1 Tax=Clostridium sp. CX1 TaxID=2978346 RepID=UPI0021C15CFE|nr:hypothetical protein [Clostridium sp. CX1]MCT8977136.1 hypothetical protein [Clostridium sp. CX1]